MNGLILGLVVIALGLLLGFRTERTWRLRGKKRSLVDPDALMAYKNGVVRMSYAYLAAGTIALVGIFTGWPGMLVIFLLMFLWGIYLYVLWVHLLDSVKLMLATDPREYVQPVYREDTEFDPSLRYTVGDDGELVPLEDYEYEDEDASERRMQHG